MFPWILLLESGSQELVVVRQKRIQSQFLKQRADQCLFQIHFSFPQIGIDYHLNPISYHLPDSLPRCDKADSRTIASKTSQEIQGIMSFHSIPSASYLKLIQMILSQNFSQIMAIYHQLSLLNYSSLKRLKILLIRQLSDLQRHHYVTIGSNL